MSDLIQAYNEGNQDEAIQAAVKAVDANPTDPRPYATLATMLIGINAETEATQLLTQALGLFPDDPELLYSFGLLGYHQGDLNTAIGAFSQLVGPTNPLKVDASYMLGLCYQQLKQPQQAVAFALTAHEAEPKRVDAALLVAELLMSLEAFKQAAAILEPLLAQRDAQVLFTYGLALSGAGEDGQTYLDQAKAIDPSGYNQKAQQVRDIAGFIKAQGEHHG